MNGYLVLILFAVVGIIRAKNSVNGEFTHRTKWFLSSLSVVPAMRATIEYDIWYPTGRPQPIITFYYKGQDSPNFRYKCKVPTKNYGQLYNKDLAIPLNENNRKNKYFCNTFSTTLGNNHGTIKIQDFEPKRYFFSLGFDCGDGRSLYCFQYNVTIYDESNTTRCVDLNMTRKYSDMSQQSLIDQCEANYQYAAIPNQFGDTDLDGAISRMNKFLRVYHSDDPSELCLKNLKPFLCEIVLPKCLPGQNKILLPCRDDCKFYMEGCLSKFMNCDYLLRCEGRNRVSGIITDKTTWFLSNLSVGPAMSASIQYNIQSWRCYPIIRFYHDGQNSTNFRDKYNKEMYGQLFNENLAVRLGGSGHTENHWCVSSEFFRYYWDCYGRIDIQDFEPKSYSFSLGIHEECDEIWKKKGLNGFYYDVTIYDESNTTRCLDLNMTHKYSDKGQHNLIDQCKANYHYAAIPNQFGDTDLDGAISRMNKFLRVNHSDGLSKHFLKNLKPFLCEIVLPRCLPEENKILLLCRDDCKFYMEDYLKEAMNCDYLLPCEGRNSVSGIITDNTKWFHGNLSVRPAMTASIEYHVLLQWPRSTLWYEILENSPIITFYYNGQNCPNLRHKCNSDMHGQLFNKDLAVPLIGRHREKFWCNYENGGIRDCHGRTEIQDFEPKSYFFSLGFECGKSWVRNLKGLKYEVTIYDESNETSCLAVNMTELHQIDSCEQNYQDVAFPNPLGHTDLAITISALESFLNNLNSQLRSLESLNKCLKELKPFLCDIYLPQCLPEKNKILLPCRDTCKSIAQDCPLNNFGMDVNCDYLPPCPPTHPNYLIIGLTVCACVIVIVMVTVCCAKNRKRISDACWAWLFEQYRIKTNQKKNDEPRLPRNRAFDAFVLYHFDTDDVFVIDTIIPELEEVRNFKLHIHSRDFTPGCDIKDNIEEAIEGSNSAIIVMSQGFVDSPWCKEELTHCYIENMKDAAFNLFVIMMQPVDTLVNISPYMKIFFETKTFLQKDDPELITKLAALLDEARKPVNDDVDNHNNDNNDNIDSKDETPREYNLLCPPDEILGAQETSV